MGERVGRRDPWIHTLWWSEATSWSVLVSFPRVLKDHVEPGILSVTCKKGTLIPLLSIVQPINLISANNYWYNLSRKLYGRITLWDVTAVKQTCGGCFERLNTNGLRGLSALFQISVVLKRNTAEEDCIFEK